MKLLKFSAAWCQPCKTLTHSINTSSLKEQIEIEEVDVDASMDLAIGFSIKSVPILVLLDDKGTEIARKGAVTNAKQIEEWLNKFKV
jgi:thioredoxin-like negative regulator of GroEL